jgi:hypothetical protein
MTTITEAQASSSAPPSGFFARWADMGTWPEWNTDPEWVRLTGPLGWFWRLVLGKGLKRSLQPDLDRLAAAAEATAAEATAT